ncbi:caspase family protein [Streptomyces sp. 8N616]|uniref:caspase family protein n=1 Tax=Streptomyces sp. 8N616 TaxID=3457414 RepID=UPI003FD31326
MHLPDPRRSRALLIGASQYANAELFDLPVVPDTLYDLTAALTDPKHGVISEEHCTVICDEGDVRQVGRVLRSTVEAAEDLLLVYYTGHGLVGGRRHELYLALTESEESAPAFNSLAYDNLRDAVLDSPASLKVIVLDCCFSGRAITGSLADASTTLLGQIEVDGSYVLTSAPRDKVALIVEGEKHTAFTGRLIRLLNEGIIGGPELLTIGDVYRYLLASMKAECLPVPQSLGTKTAELLVLGRNRAFGASPAPEPRREQRRAAELSGTVQLAIPHSSNQRRHSGGMRAPGRTGPASWAIILALILPVIAGFILRSDSISAARSEGNADSSSISDSPRDSARPVQVQPSPSSSSPTASIGTRDPMASIGDRPVNTAEVMALHPCIQTDLSLRVKSAANTYGPDVWPEFPLMIQHDGDGACRVNLGRTSSIVTISTAEDERVWSSGDCPPSKEARWVGLTSEETVTETFRWERKRSEPKCGTPSGKLDDGTYFVTASLEGLTAETVFHLGRNLGPSDTGATGGTGDGDLSTTVGGTTTGSDGETADGGAGAGGGDGSTTNGDCGGIFGGKASEPCPSSSPSSNPSPSESSDSGGLFGGPSG